jgi:hypothetical protein
MKFSANCGPFATTSNSHAMPRDGAITLTDLQAPLLHLVCEPCGQRGRYAVARLIAQRGDAKLTDLLPALANCPKERIPRASTIVARPGSRRLFVAAVPVRRQTNDDLLSLSPGPRICARRSMTYD